MEQLKMYYIFDNTIEMIDMPDEYDFSKYCDEKDKTAWCECCRNGLIGDNDDETVFDKSILDLGINPYEDVFFLDFNGEHIGTITAFVNSNGAGQIHMVGIRSDFRGKGLSNYLMNVAICHLQGKNIKYALLTTDEWRVGAVKGYLTAGFLPVEYSEGMEERWKKVLKFYNIDGILMLNEDTTPYKVIYKDET